MTKDNSYTPSCVDCGTQNCKFKDRTYPEFCLTTGCYGSQRRSGV